MRRNTGGGDVWRTLSAALLGVLFAGTAAWLLVGQKAVGREEVERMIAAESPYITDRRAIQERLEANSLLLARIAADIGEIKVEQARLAERIEALTGKRTAPSATKIAAPH